MQQKVYVLALVFMYMVHAKSEIGDFISPVVMWLIVFAGFALGFYILGSNKLFERGLLSWLLLAVAIVYWSFLFFGAVGVNKMVARSSNRTPHIIKAGVYGRVRHPIYSADIALMWGIFLFFPVSGLLACAIWLTVILIIWSMLEESVLIHRFGEQYTNYQRQVPMLVPDFSK
jgi:protein-S-isoprenylcysteine O-methyltransferase Ste14